MRHSYLLVLAALVCGPLYANQRYNGNCSQGNRAVITSGVAGAPKVMASYPQCRVTVYLTASLTLATIYSDNVGTVKANPFTASTDGSFFLYAANGRYDITLSSGGFPSPYTIGDVLLADPFAAGGLVTSWNARTGAVVPAASDYTWSLIGGAKQGNTNVPQMAGTNSGVNGASLCNDGSGNSTTSGCTAALPSASAQLQYLRIKPNAGNTTTYEFQALPVAVSTDYNFAAQTPGGNLAIGANTVTLTPCPLGVAGANTNQTLYLSGGAGTAEAALITGGTCTSGATTGTIILTAANTHTGAWTVQSSTAGIAEAIRSVSGAVAVSIPVGLYNIYGTIVIDKDSVRLEGLGTGGTLGFAGDPPPNALASVKLTWLGAAYGTFISIVPATNSIRKDIVLRNFTLDGGTILYAQGIYAKAMTGSRLEDINLWSPAPDSTTTFGAIYLTSGDGGAGSNRNVSENVFRNINCREYGAPTRPDAAVTGACWYFDRGGNLSSDISRNLFISIRNWFAGTGGIVAYNSDSNTFIEYEGFGIAGTGPGYLVPSTAPFAGGHYFLHFNSTYRADIGINLDRIFMSIDNTNPADAVTISAGSGAILVEGKNNTNGSVRQLIRAPSGLGSAMTDNNWGPLIMSGPSAFTGSLTNRTVSNFIATETGANNAIVAALLDPSGTAVAQTDGTMVTVRLAHSLQAGANTFNFNGNGALAIRKSSDPTATIGRAYTSLGYIRLLLSGNSSVWLDMSQ